MFDGGGGLWLVGLSMPMQIIVRLRVFLEIGDLGHMPCLATAAAAAVIDLH
jgi:hypothetical protein